MAWLVLVRVAGTLSCGGVTTGSTSRADPSREGGAGSDGDGAHSTTDAGAPSAVDCAARSPEACRAQSCMPILASPYDAFSNCLNRPEAVACIAVETSCGGVLTIARSSAGECRVFTSTCLAPGWSPVADPATDCGSAISTNAPACKEVFGPCPTEPCPVTVIRSESLADGAASPTPCWFTLPPRPQGPGGSVPLNLANLYDLTTNEPRPVPYVVDAAHCDPANGGWYFGETDAGVTSMDLCPITCALPRDPLGRGPLELFFGCPTRRADGLCTQ